MKFCTECGAQNNDAARFCEKCGKPFAASGASDDSQAGVGSTATGGSAPAQAVAQAVTQAVNVNTSQPSTGLSAAEIASKVGVQVHPAFGAQLHSIFNIPSKDVVISSIGNSYVQSLLSGGTVRRTVACFTGNRLYYQGSTYNGHRRSFAVTSGSVLLKDITYTGLTFVNPLGGMIFAALISVMVGAMILLMWNSPETSKGIEGYLSNVLSTAWFGLWIAAAWYFLYIRRRHTVFRIDFPGTGLVFNLSNYPEEEVDEFKDTITRCIDLSKGVS